MPVVISRTVGRTDYIVATHLLIKLFMLGPLDKSFMVGGGEIAIIASSSRGPGGT